jgi:hypothetical protein
MKSLYKELLFAIAILCLYGRQSTASSYLIDTEGGHAFIQFRISHLGAGSDPWGGVGVALPVAPNWFWLILVSINILVMRLKRWR